MHDDLIGAVQWGIDQGVIDPNRAAIMGRSQSDRMAAVLEEHGKDVEYVLLNNEGHHFGRWSSNLKIYRKTEDFLAACLGGRTAGFDYYQLAAWMF